MSKEKHELRKILGYLPQEFGLYPKVNALELFDHLAIMKGISNFDQSISFLKITKNDKLKQINYWIGKDIDNLIPRINVRIMLTDDINKNQLLMISLKTNDMNSERWNKLKELHNLEVKKIKEFIENLIP